MGRAGGLTVAISSIGGGFEIELHKVGNSLSVDVNEEPAVLSPINMRMVRQGLRASAADFVPEGPQTDDWT
jgi:hypothetical protein